jgi:hypothetical protein
MDPENPPIIKVQGRKTTQHCEKRIVSRKKKYIF